MDVQTISVATAVVSAAIAALGLLLSWYRREGDKGERKSHWPFIAACAGIIVLTVLGVTLTFMLGADTKSSVDTGSPGVSSPLTEVQYKGQLGAVCSDAKEKARRIEELHAQATVLGAAIQIEQDEEGQIRKLQPPDKLKSIHDDMVSVWQRRISLLESIYHRRPQLNEHELATELATADRLAEQLTDSFNSLGVPECSF